MGLSNGQLDQYTLQSGRHVAMFGKNNVHNGPVRAIATDALNTLVLSGGRDGVLKVWLLMFACIECRIGRFKIVSLKCY